MLKLKLLPMMQKKGVSKNKLAELLDVRRKSINPWFKEGQDMKFSTVEKLARFLECEPLELIYQDDEKRKEGEKPGKKREPKKKKRSK